MTNSSTNHWGAEQFWASQPILPRGLALERRSQFHFLARAGPGGSEAFEDVVLRTPTGALNLLLAYKSPLVARDVPKLKARLRRVLDELRGGERGLPDATARFPVVATDVATPSVREACEREWLGLIDQRGTVVLHDGPAYVHVEGTRPVARRTRATLFRGRGARVVRCLLENPGQPFAVAELATRCETSVGYTFAVLLKLEAEGFVERRSPRSGFILTRAAALLEAWLASGTRAAVVVESFYAPSTSASVVDATSKRLTELKLSFAWTLAGALKATDVVVSGLPLGLYLHGDATPVVEALQLRRTTPHNFLLLRPEPEAATTAFGVFRDGAATVTVPQLILDLTNHGGPRAKEQTEHTMRRWRESLGPSGGPP